MSYNGSGTFLINTAGQPVVSGTVISSTAFNALTADLATGLSTAITKDGQTTVTANIPMGTYKFTGLGAGTAATDSANLSQVQSTVTKLLASVSGADTITAVGSPTLGAYAAGQMFYFIAAGDNTGAVTLNIDSLGAKAVTRDGTTALAAGDIQSGEVCVVVYDGTRFQLVNGASQSASIVTENLTVNKATVLNESGGDNDTRIEGDTDANLVFVDASTDRVGVGTNAPAHKFHTNGVVRGAFDDGVFLSSVGASDNYFVSANYANNNGTESVTESNRASWRTAMQIGGAGSRLYKISYRAPTAAAGTWSDFVTVNESGQVGIGTTSPSTALTVSGANTAARGQLSVVGASASPRITLYEDSTFYAAFAASGTDAYIGTESNTPFRFITNGTERARFTAGGDFGIGTTSPQAYTNYTVLTVDNATNGGVVSVRRNGNALLNLYTGSGEGRVEAANSAFLSFYTTSAERARITSGGKWIVNDTAASGNDELVVIKATSTASTAAAIRIINSAGTELFFVRNDGAFRTGTGATSPVNLTTGNAANVWVDTDGTLRKSTSSIKYKDNVQDSTHGLAEVLALRPVTYNGKNDGEKIFGGLIAEEVHDAGLSEFVAYAEDGTPDALHYGNMVSLAFKAIQEQQALIKSLEAKVAALEAK